MDWCDFNLYSQNRSFKGCFVSPFCSLDVVLLYFFSRLWIYTIQDRLLLRHSHKRLAWSRLTSAINNILFLKTNMREYNVCNTWTVLKSCTILTIAFKNRRWWSMAWYRYPRVCLRFTKFDMKVLPWSWKPHYIEGGRQRDLTLKSDTITESNKICWRKWHLWC